MTVLLSSGLVLGIPLGLWALGMKMRYRWCMLLVLLVSLTHCGGSDGTISPEQVLQPPRAAQPDKVAPLIFAFTGTVGVDYGTVEGTFSYTRTAEPSAVDVRGLSPNVVYTLTAWTITMHPTVPGGQSSVTFSNTVPTHTAEFCVGICIFSAQAYEWLRFSDGEQSLYLAFTILSLDPFREAPPDSLVDWGPLHAGDTGASYFQSPVVLALLSGGTMLASSGVE